MLRALSRGILALGFATSLLAQRPSPTPAAPQIGTADVLHSAGKDVTISLLTMGNGDEIWELFGHDALLIHDNVTARDTVFNWGVFSFRQSNFLLRFLKGDMWYAMGGDSLQWIGIAYRYLNRSVYSQELDLTAGEKDSILK